MKHAILFIFLSILSTLALEAKAASCWEIISTPNISVLGNVVLNPTPISCTTTPSGKAWLQVTVSYSPPPPTDLFLLINLSDPHMSGLTFSPLLIFNGFNSSNVPIVSTDIIGSSSTMTATILPPSLPPSTLGFNVDFCNNNGWVSSTFSGVANQAGFWNQKTAFGGALTDINGDSSLGVTMTPVGGGPCISQSNPATSGDNEALMDDFWSIGAANPVGRKQIISNLPAGTYQVYTYAWRRASPNSPIGYTSVDVNNIGTQIIGGSWSNGIHSQGLTYSLHTVAINSGDNITIHWVTTQYRGAANGIQIKKLSTDVDVWVEDTPHNYLGTPDSGDEPDSNMTNQAMWKSRAIWNRKISGECNSTANPDINNPFNPAHENPEFGQLNYLCIRVKNKGGNTALNTTVKAYWANPSTGLAWSDPALGASQWTEINSSPKIMSSIISGSDEIVEMSWSPPNVGHFCLVARIDNASDVLIGEGSDINYNTRYKNNIAWRNVNIVDLSGKTGITHNFTIHQLSETKVTQIRFNFTNDKGETVTPPEKLTQITLGGLNNLKFDQKAIEGFKLTETREGGTSAQMTEDKASFDVVMIKGEEHILQLTFAPTALKELTENISFNIEQYEGEERVGGISYSLNIQKETKEEQDTGQKTQEGTSNHINYFTLTLSSALTSDASVDYQTRDGTAIAGEDYTATKGTAIISAGETTILIGVEILADENDEEGDESFSLVLTNPKNGLFPQGQSEVVATHIIVAP